MTVRIGTKTAFIAIASVAFIASPALANEAMNHQGHEAPMTGGHADGGHDMAAMHEGHDNTASHDEHGGGHHDAGFSAEIGVGVASGYERFSAIVTDETVTKGFGGVSYNFGNGFHAGVHGLIASTSKEQFELEVAPHVGYHGDGFSVSAAWNSVNHTNHDLTTTEAQIGAGYEVAEHTTIEALANFELDHEKRSFYEAGVAYARPLTHEVGFRFNARFGYLRTDGIVASHDAGHTTTDTEHETATGGETTTDTGHETTTGGHRSTASTVETATAGEATTHETTATGDSFAGLQRSSVEAAIDYEPAALHGLKITGFARAIFPLSDDGKKDMEARSFDGKTSAITLFGLEASYGF